MPHDPEAFADMVVMTVKAAMAPYLERMAAAEARLSVLGDVRDRVVAIETKSVMPLAPDPVVHELRDRVFAIETKAVPVVYRTDDVTPRVAVLEAGLSVLETKAAMSVPPPVDLSKIHERLTAIETTQAIPTAAEIMLNDVKARLSQLETKSVPDGVGSEMAALRERVAVLEVRPVAPGPAGEPGPAGKDGAAGLSWEGVHQDGRTYEKGHLVTWAGSSWHCNAPTTTKPGEGSKDWTLMVKRGRDGRDGKDAEMVPVVSVGSR